jgi:tripeptidyl-peptidase-1
VNPNEQKLIDASLVVGSTRSQAGKPPLGFLNPFLYANANAFTDIIAGNNRHGRGTTYPYGWDCAVGWDPITGLGTPKFQLLLKAALTA